MTTAAGRAGHAVLRLGVLGEPELVVAGLHGMLGPHRQRVQLAVLDGAGTTDDCDVVLYDPLSHPGDPRENVAKVVALGGAKVLVLTWNPSAPGMERVLAAGAHGVVAKASSTEVLVDAVEASHRGEPTGLHPVPASFPRLSQRESEVLTLICRGLSNLEIAAELYVSVNSVKTYIRQIYQKTGATRRTQAVAWAHQHGLVG